MLILILVKVSDLQICIVVYKVLLCCHQRRNCFKPFHTVDKGNIINFNYADSDQNDQESDADDLDSEENAHSDFSENC